jgi:hypothetical protein
MDRADFICALHLHPMSQLHERQRGAGDAAYYQKFHRRAAFLSHPFVSRNKRPLGECVREVRARGRASRIA